jgi:hypothetical protein
LEPKKNLQTIRLSVVKHFRDQVRKLKSDPIMKNEGKEMLFDLRIEIQLKINTLLG